MKIGSGELDSNHFSQIVQGQTEVEISEEAIEKVVKSFEFLGNFSKDKVIYGINTGFGSMAQFKIDDKHRKELQFNLIRSHSSGAGAPLPDVYLRGVILARLNTLLKGYSGIHPEVVETLALLLNKNVSPLILEHGGVGASGDLVQLAHLALGLIGEGEARYKDKIVSTEEAFKKAGIKPIQIHIREGLALMNGTSAMTGIGLINLQLAKRALHYSIAASSMINEVVQAYDDHYSFELNATKRHNGQAFVAAEMRKLLAGSKLTKHRPDHLYNKKVEVDVIKEKVQEYYSVRCVPQILGPVWDTLEFAEKVLVDELNSVNDNPVIDAERKNVFHGGNFHGDYVALEMDKVKIAMTKTSMLAERQLNFLFNDKLNNILPPFVNLGKLGLNFGMQGVQFTATSTTAENQTLSNPMYVHSIPCNNDNQDIVSMGTNGALITKKVIDNTFDVLAIEMMSIAQAIDYIKSDKKMSPLTRKVYDHIRKISDRFIGDSPKYKEIEKLSNYLKNNDLEF